jgi:hypothetical protein
MAMTRSERAPLVTDAIPPPLRRRGITQRQLLVAVLTGALVLALFASHDTPVWTEHLGDSPFVHRLYGAIVSWNDAMEQAGLGRPHKILRDATVRVLNLQWNGDNN